MKKGLTKAVLVGIAISIAAAFAPISVKAADIPCSTAKLIVPWGAGGGTDVLFRVFAETANKQGAKPQLQVVNIGGQGGNKGAKVARKAKPDGCTLFAIHQSALTSNLTGRVDFTWDAFEPVARLTRTPLIVGANPDVPYNNVVEMIANAKERPGELLTGGTLGSTSHFFFLVIQDEAGIKLKHISYDGTRQRMTGLLAKTIEIGEINLASAKKYIQTNELKALGISTKERHPDIPDVATLQEQGVDLVFGTDRGIMLPKGASKEVIQHFVDIMAKVANDPAYKKSIENKGSTVEFLAGDDYVAYFKETFIKWTAIAKSVGVYRAK